MSAAIHIHVILADINREDERFLLGARLHPSFLVTCEREGYFFASTKELGGKPRHMGSSLWCAVRRSFYLVDPLCGTVQVCVCRSRTDLQDEDKCRVSMLPFTSENSHFFFIEFSSLAAVFNLFT